MTRPWNELASSGAHCRCHSIHVTLVKSFVAGDFDYDLGGGVQFRLTYEGQLLGASSTNTRASHKHKVRRAFHPQLKNLWMTTRHLSARGSNPFSTGSILVNSQPPIYTTPSRLEWLASKYVCNGYRFIPLVTEDLSLLCSIDILFLRPDQPGTLISSGDIDNRMKTLFDALRVPTIQEMANCTAPSVGEDPFFCLLEDDKLISHLSVETDMLLEPTSSAPNDNDARVVITVRIKPYEVTIGNLSFA